MTQQGLFGSRVGAFPGLMMEVRGGNLSYLKSLLMKSLNYGKYASVLRHKT
ncbi:MAG: hypothetical protein LBS81_01835 [Endomicrobium sp.]|nr:hypothetical protein [Endomicrobium sp.]